MLKGAHILLIFISSIFMDTCDFSLSNELEKNTATTHYDISYGTDVAQTLDLCLPKKKTDSIPMVILVHGGAWCFGEKETLTPVQKFLAQHNIPSANINYRLNRGNITYKDQLEDIDKALDFLKNQADSLNLPCRFILFGESAGAHLSLLYGYQNPDCIEKIISLAAPTDFFSKNYRSNKLYHWYTKFFFELATGAKYNHNKELKAFQDASPIKNVSNVPTLILQGTSDMVVDVSQALSLDTALTKKKVPHKLVLMKGGIHISRRLPWWRDKVIYPEMLAFFNEKVKAKNRNYAQKHVEEDHIFGLKQ